MKAEAHGGDLLAMSQRSGREPADILDFSVNVRPEGTPEFLRAALLRAADSLNAYPSPRAEEACQAAARRHKLPASRFAFGNGSNEIIHALARVLKKRGVGRAAIVEPAFSEYALACRLADIPLVPVWGGFSAGNLDALLAELEPLPSGSAVWMANPGNPSGLFYPPESLLSLTASRPDLIWILDEAFIEYAGEEYSLLSRLPENAVILRSLTKFHALPGLRLGYMAASEETAAAVRAEMPAWNVNAFALAAAVAALDDRSDFAPRSRAENAERRADLVAALRTLPEVEVFPSLANYVLFRWKKAPRDLYDQLLCRFGIAVRDCSNYHGLEDGTWFRAAVRFPADHRRLAEALRSVMEERRPAAAPRHHTPALMLQGTSSNAGKSILAAAYCRIFEQDGYRVAPFKAQNMSLNSGVTAAGDEMGRAQIVQAQAARVDPDARMNPILLKPHSNTGSQVIVLGKAQGHMKVREYYAKKKELWSAVTGAYDSLAAEHDIMVLEGAGSPGEINLKSHDLVNMRMAEYAGASVLLVGDIDRGGVYASFLGTWMTFTPREKKLLTGYIVNRFRGDASLLAPAHDYMQEHTGTPVLGTIPYIPDLGLPEEDMAGFSWESHPVCAPKTPDTLDIAVIMPRHVSNYTDFAPLAIEKDVRLRPVRTAEEWGEPDVIMLPGSKSVVADLAILRESGLAARISAHAAAGKWVFGICGGLQMLGRSIIDPHGVESPEREVAGLGIMDLCSTFAADKTLIKVPEADTPLGPKSGGYEIHHAITTHGPAALPAFRRCGPEWSGKRDCGYVQGRCWATYLHGVFDDDAFRRAWLDHVRQDLGMSVQGRITASYDLEKALDRLADIVRANSDMDAIYRSMGL